MANTKKAKELYEKYLNGTCTEEEKALVERSILHIFPLDTSIEPQTLQTRSDQIKEALENKIGQPARPLRQSKWYYAAAAVFIATLGTALYFNSGLFVSRKPEIVKEIGPGGNRAILTLADGTKVVLDSAQSGIIVGKENIKYQSGKSLPGVILRANEGSHKPGETRSSPLLYAQGDVLLQLSTPRGGVYQIILPDGTKVWLNAQSTLKYPSRFSGINREIEITGEAFFDIAQVKGQPFKVKSKRQVVDVLGTSFNVSAYDGDEPVRTTLVTGAVQVASYKGTSKPEFQASSYKRLAPGQQSILSKSGIQVETVDVEQYTSWHDGYFKFNGDLRSIMAQIGRWYNVEVVFEDGYPDKLEMQGLIKRDKSLNQLLSLMGAGGTVHFKLETNNRERRVIVTK